MVSYWHTIKTQPVFYQMEKERVLNIMNSKYKNDEEFRNKRKEYQRLYRLKLKQLKQQEQNDISI